MRRIIKEKKYEALGFVEALIAIMVVGISSVVLMQIAVNTMHNTIQNETIDKMTQYAVEGAEMAQEIARKESGSGEDVFPNPVLSSCYYFDNESSEVAFRKSSEDVFRSFSLDQRSEFKNVAVIMEEGEDGYEETDFFRVVCVEPMDSGSSFVVAKIVVGQRISDGTITKGNQVKDYTYLTVVKL